VVDSLPYLYFLQYKTYGHLQRYDEQRQALNKLVNSIYTTRNIGHKETALNLLGQCYQQENRNTEALHCYINSIRIRPTNNAAKLHICLLLFAIYNTMQGQV
jgi:tetratricopeptide (TPR) repeat protein